MTDEQLDEICKAHLARRGYLVIKDASRSLGLVERINLLVTDRTQVTMVELLGPGRSRTLALARQLAMYLARKLTNLSFKEIGNIYSRDHGTVIHAERTIERALKADPALNRLVVDIRNGLL